MVKIQTNMIGLMTIARREVTRFFRIWTQSLLPSAISMGLYFIIFGKLIGSRIGQMGNISYIEYIIPGLVMMSIITNSYANVSTSFFISKFQRNIEEILVSPLSNTIILWGYVLGGVCRGIIVGTLVLGVSMFFSKLPMVSFTLTLLIATLSALLFSIAGLINGVLARKFDDVEIVPTFILSPLIYLGGVFYSIQLLPGFWQKMTLINPMFYMVNAFRHGMLGNSDVEIQMSILVILCIIISLYGLALWLLNKGFGLRT